MEESTAKNYEALFDGDEIDGKVYGLGDLVTGLDAATGAFLSETGRISEIGEERAKVLKGRSNKRNASEKADAAAEEAEAEAKAQADAKADEAKAAAAKAEADAKKNAR